MVANRADTRRALHGLRAVRRRRHFEDQDWTDSVYKAYLAMIVAGLATFYLSPVFGEGHVSASFLDEVHHRGAAVLGVVFAMALLLGLRSGARGGPLALQEPDVVHVLLAPLRRATALRAAALSQLRSLVFLAALSGAVAGTLASHRMPGPDPSWIATGAALGVLLAFVVWGGALLASGARLSMRTVTSAGVALVGWATFDVVTRSATSPTSQIGRVGLAPLDWSPWALLGIGVALALPIAGLALAGGISLELAQVRASLVGQLRFAATLQDIRTVMVLHRQLAQERPRAKPWWQVSTRAFRSACWHRDWQGIARWPAARVARGIALSAVAGAALAATWYGATPLVLVAGIALFFAALDAAEGLAQETDHPERAAGYPELWGWLILRHLAVPVALLTIVELPALAVFVVLTGTMTPLWVAALSLAIAATSASVAAATMIVLGAPRPDAMFMLGFPEIGSFVIALRQLFPVALVVAAVAPVAIADQTHGYRVDPVLFAAVGVVALSGALLFWLRSRRFAFG